MIKVKSLKLNLKHLPLLGPVLPFGMSGEGKAGLIPSVVLFVQVVADWELC